MSQVQIEAKKFADRLDHWQPVKKDLISMISTEVAGFYKQRYKLEFLETVINEIRGMYDQHLTKCTHQDKSKCIENQRFEEQLFFLQDALDDLYEKQRPLLNVDEKEEIEFLLNQILLEINGIRETQQISTSAFAGEVDLIKNFLWKNRGTLGNQIVSQFFQLTAGATVSAVIAPDILQLGGILRKMVLKN